MMTYRRGSEPDWDLLRLEESGPVAVPGWLLAEALGSLEIAAAEFCEKCVRLQVPCGVCSVRRKVLDRFAEILRDR